MSGSRFVALGSFTPGNQEKLSSAVAFDGLMAVGNEVYMVTQDNRLICVGQK